MIIIFQIKIKMKNKKIWIKMSMTQMKMEDWTIIYTCSSKKQNECVLDKLHNMTTKIKYMT